MRKRSWNFLLLSALMVASLIATAETGLNYEIRGTGKPVVLIHGGLVDSRMWDTQMAELAKEFQVIRYDLRGFGKSPATSEPVSHVDDLRALLESLKIEKASIIGLSLGGMIAIDFTLDHPAMVDKLILAGAAVRGYAYKPAGNRDAIYETAKKGDIDKAVDLWMSDSVFVTARNYPEAEKKMRQMVLENSKTWITPPKTVWPKQSSIERLSEIKVPTLIIVGEQDNENILAVADVLKKEIAGSRKNIITNTGHHMNMETPHEFNAMVLQFLKAPSE